MADPKAAAATTIADRAVATERYLDGVRIDKAIRQVQSDIGGPAAAMPAIDKEVEDHGLLTDEEQRLLDNVLKGEESSVPTPSVFEAGASAVVLTPPIPD